MFGRVLSVVPVREGQNRVRFECEDAAGLLYGPMVEFRPADEDPAEFVAGYAAELEAGALAAAEPEKSEEEELRALARTFKPETIKAVFGELADAELAVKGGE